MSIREPRQFSRLDHAPNTTRFSLSHLDEDEVRDVVDVPVVRGAEEDGEEAGHDHAEGEEVAQVDALGDEAAEF